MLTAFFLKDEFRDNIVYQSSFASNPSVDGNVVENVSDPRPRVRWVSGFDNALSAIQNFQVDNDNRYLEFSSTPAGTITTITVPTGSYNGGDLALEISNLLQAEVLTASWSCSYNYAIGKFNLAGSPNLYIRWKTGVHGSDGDGKSLAKELGFDDTADDGPTGNIDADEERWSTHSWVRFDLAASADLRAFLCHVDTEDNDGTIDDSNIRIFGNSTNLGSGGNLANWQTNASKNLAFSSAPTYSENQIRLAHNANVACAERYWLWSWRHQDEVKRHKIGLVKAFKRTWSATRTITTLRGHGLLNPQRGLGINNYYPVNQLRRWNVPLAFDAWSASDYRTVIQGVVRHGKQDGLLWALRWDEIADGTYTANSEADKGFLVWGSLQDYSRDTYVGEGADYISGDLKIEQLR